MIDIESRKALKLEQEKFAKKQAEQYKKSLRAVMKTKEGRFVLRVIMNKCKVLQASPTDSPQQKVINSYLQDLYLLWIRPYLDNPHDLER